MEQRGHLGALTGLRFFAAAAIVLHHISGRLMPDDSWNAGGSLAQGVSIFFVLSGFILAYQYPAVNGPAAAAKFLYARAAKVFPSHLVMLSIWLLVFGFDGSSTNLFFNLLLLQSWVPSGDTYFAYNSVSWSLSTEMAFYAVFPLLMYRVRHFWPAYLGFTVFLASVCVRVANGWALPGYVPGSAAADYLGIVMVNPVARVFEFCCGIAASVLFRSRSARPTRSASSASALELCAILLVVFNLTIARETLFPLLPNWGAAGSFWFGNSLAPALPAALLIYVLARGEGVLSRFLAWRPMRYLGATSFALYLTHPLVAYLAEVHVDETLALPVFLAASLFGSFLLHELIELPAQRFLRGARRSSRIPTQAADIPAVPVVQSS